MTFTLITILFWLGIAASLGLSYCVYKIYTGLQGNISQLQTEIKKLKEVDRTSDK